MNQIHETFSEKSKREAINLAEKFRQFFNRQHPTFAALQPKSSLVYRAGFEHVHVQYIITQRNSDCRFTSEIFSRIMKEFPVCKEYVFYLHCEENAAPIMIINFYLQMWFTDPEPSTALAKAGCKRPRV